MNDINWNKLAVVLRHKAGETQDHANATREKSKQGSLDAAAIVLRALADAIDAARLP